MKPDSHMYYTRIETLDGVQVPFPVSRHIVRIRASAAQTPTRSSFFAQSASLALTLALCISSFSMSFGNIDNTLSYFRDEETSRDNAFAAGSLGFRLNPGEVTLPIHAGDRIQISPLFEPDSESLSMKYRVRAEILEDSSLCNLLEAHGTSSPYLYSGALRTLVTAPATTTGHGNLEVTLASAANIANGTRCSIALVYKSWHEAAPEGTGYSDEERDIFTFVLDAPAENTQENTQVDTLLTPAAEPQTDATPEESPPPPSEPDSEVPPGEAAEFATEQPASETAPPEAPPEALSDDVPSEPTIDEPTTTEPPAPETPEAIAPSSPETPEPQPES